MRYLYKYRSVGMVHPHHYLPWFSTSYSVVVKNIVDACFNYTFKKSNALILIEQVIELV